MLVSIQFSWIFDGEGGGRPWNKEAYMDRTWIQTFTLELG
jgi:hypothetical protein